MNDAARCVKGKCGYTHGKVLSKTFELATHPIVCRGRFLFPAFFQFIERALEDMKRTNLLLFRFLRRVARQFKTGKEKFLAYCSQS